MTNFSETKKIFIAKRTFGIHRSTEEHALIRRRRF